MEPRASHMVSRCSDVERHPSDNVFFNKLVRETEGHLLGKAKCFRSEAEWPHAKVPWAVEIPACSLWQELHLRLHSRPHTLCAVWLATVPVWRAKGSPVSHKSSC